MPYVQETVKAGNVTEISKYHTRKYQVPKGKRNKNTGITTLGQEKINERRAEKKLRLLIYANFREDDLYLTLTYGKEKPEPEEAKTILAKFLRKLRAAYKKAGQVLKYIAVTEYKNKRIHHHLLINQSDHCKKREIERLWGYGYQVAKLYGGTHEDGERLASYFVKETNNTFNAPDKVHGLRWVASKNLVHPEPDTKVVKAGTWKKKPVPPTGYRIETMREGVTSDNYEYQFYRMVRIEEQEKGRKRSE